MWNCKVIASIKKLTPMNRKILHPILFILLICLSCKFNENNHFNEKIIGNWAYTRIEYSEIDTNKDGNLIPPTPINFYENDSGYTFSKNNVCENKRGYFKENTKNELENSASTYLGNTTTYKIEKDSLKIFNISDSSWNSRKIYSITDDTLTFQAEKGILIKYTKIKNKPKAKVKVERIIVSSSGCYGTCPISDVSIDESGNVIFFGDQYNSKNGFFTSNITTAEYEELTKDLRFIDIMELKPYYQANRTDDETVYITFISDNKILKSVTDYGAKSPHQLVWTYTPIRYLYQKLTLAPHQKPPLLLDDVQFEASKKSCVLSRSESFFLSTELSKAKVTSKSFQKKYKINSWDDNTIGYTDGRFYQLKDKTLDLGYNFLTKNNLNLKFKERNYN